MFASLFKNTDNKNISIESYEETFIDITDEIKENTDNRGKSLSFHTPNSIHTTEISTPSPTSIHTTEISIPSPNSIHTPQSIQNENINTTPSSKFKINNITYPVKFTNTSSPKSISKFKNLSFFTDKISKKECLVSVLVISNIITSIFTILIFFKN